MSDFLGTIFLLLGETMATSLDIPCWEFFFDIYLQRVHEGWIRATNNAIIATTASTERPIASGRVV
jgi:hypothetical protein